ncbi:hypothetical protein BC830DRAFT_1146568 [Chytriomyces sp. MP71]|nr:hypothetical protein BC830DRAFT_1146568 [Chytriomyces sp. MP71]
MSAQVQTVVAYPDAACSDGPVYILWQPTSATTECSPISQCSSDMQGLSVGQSQRVECVSAEELDSRVKQLFSIRNYVNTSIYFDPTCQKLSYRTFEAINMCLLVTGRSWRSELLEPMGGGALNHYAFTDMACTQGGKVSWNTSRNGVCFSTGPGDYISVNGIPLDASGPAISVANDSNSTSFPVAAVAGGIVAAVLLSVGASIAWYYINRRNVSKMSQATPAAPSQNFLASHIPAPSNEVPPPSFIGSDSAASILVSDTLVTDKGVLPGILTPPVDIEHRSMSTFEFSGVAVKESAENTKFSKAALDAGQSDALSNSFLCALEPVPPAYDDEFGSVGDGSTVSSAVAAFSEKKAVTKPAETWTVEEVSTWISQFSEDARKNVIGQHINGEALLLLNRPDLQTILGSQSLGLVVRVEASILNLRK